ncbi:MAG TPA: hypothetical protein VG268_04425 [Streptosporangiaceae bacterium]|jgi:hypothetical protein|nr:hypothetical protein [Streptosporangiaceae bacterium]
MTRPPSPAPRTTQTTPATEATRAILAILAALVTVVTLAAGPAVAQTGPVGSAGCSGVSCWAQLGVRLSGPGYQPGSAPNTGFTLTAVPPPPCWYTPFQSARGMLDFLNAELTSPGAAADGVPQLLAVHEDQIRTLAKAGAAGEWYTLTEPTPPAAGSLSCIQRTAGTGDARYYLWIPAGQAAPQPDVPAQDLAEYAYSQLTLPGPRVAADPMGTTYVSLPTYLRAANVNPVFITARLGDEQVTVTATPAGLAIAAAGATPYANGRAGDCRPRGSTASAAVVSTAGPGDRPDCGLVFQSPSAAPVTITAAEAWTASWAGAGRTGQPLPQQPVPTPATPPVALQVNEIQSVNGGAG